MQLPELPQPAEVVARLEVVRRTEQQLLSAAGTVHKPEGEVASATEGTANWAKERLENADRLSTVLASLVTESNVRIATTPPTAALPSLEAAMRQAAQGEAAASVAVLATETA